MADFSDPRVTEKRFLAIPPQAMTVNGTTNGIFTIASTYCFKVGQIVTVVSSAVQPRRLKIKGVLSETEIQLGPIDKPIHKFSDVSDLLVADSAMIELIDDSINSGSQASNRRPVIDLYEINRQVYEEEPTVAIRSHLVDWLGRSYSEDNPLPVDAVVNVGDVNVNVDGIYDAGNNPDPANVGVIGHERTATPGDSDQTNRITSVTYGEGGVVHALDVAIQNSDGSPIDNSNPLPVVLATGITVDGNVIDPNNSTVSALGIGATFTGATTDAEIYNAAYVQLISDEDSAANGLVFQTSNDGSNWDHLHAYSYVGPEGKHFEVALSGKYFRVVYTNGSVAQSFFRMQTKLLVNASQEHNHPLNAQIDVDHPAPVVRAMIGGEDNNGVFTNARVTNAGKLKVYPTNPVADDLKVDANIQVGDADASASNPVPSIRHNALVVTRFDDIILTRNAQGQLLNAEYKKLGSTTATVAITRNAQGQITRVTRTPSV